MRVPDHHTSKLGCKDFVFQVNKWPFAITCNPQLPTITESFIDLGLVKDMKISMKKLECRNISYAGIATKVVGSISQTVQVVYDGVASGTMHLKAKVIRNLSSLYGVDCIAGRKLYSLFTRSDSLPDLANSSHGTMSDISDNDVEPEASDDQSEASRATDLVLDGDDSPETSRKKRRKRFTVANLSFTSSMRSTPVSSPKASSPTSTTDAQVPISNACLTPSSPGTSIPMRCQPTHVAQNRQDLPPPTVVQNPPKQPEQLHDLIFCGHHHPCLCLDTLRNQQLGFLPPHYPVYLPVGHQPCREDCGSQYVHLDNLHPPNPNLCPCSPPRLNPVLGQPHSTPNSIQLLHAQMLPVQLLHAQDEEPPLPPDFAPCGDRCQYELCECLRYYAGRDWDS